jgi:hypothetical protein
MEAKTKVYKTPSYTRTATINYYNRNKSNPEFMEKMKARSKARYAMMKQKKLSEKSSDSDSINEE